MDIEAIRQRLAEHLPDCEIELNMEGNHLGVIAVGDCFSGKRPVQRQQMVYAALQTFIADGSVHAVNMKTLTVEEAS